MSWAFYFAWYENMKYEIQEYRGSLSYYDYFLASGAAGRSINTRDTQSLIYSDRTCRCSDCRVYESDLGDQDTYIIDFSESSRSLHIDA